MNIFLTCVALELINLLSESYGLFLMKNRCAFWSFKSVAHVQLHHKAKMRFSYYSHCVQLKENIYELHRNYSCDKHYRPLCKM